MASSSSLRPQAAGAPDLKVFDEIITRTVMALGFIREPPFSFTVRDQDHTRVYEGVYEFHCTGPAQHYEFSAVVALAGVLLDAREYERRRAEIEHQPNPGEVDNEFPAIGMKARRDVVSAGPGGAVFGLTFTTSDGKFDVRVVVGNLLPTNVEDPNFSVAETARRISYLYDTKEIRHMDKHAGRAWYAVQYCGAKAGSRLLKMQTLASGRDPVAYQLGCMEGLKDGEGVEGDQGRETACAKTRALYGPDGSTIPGLIE